MYDVAPGGTFILVT